MHENKYYDTNSSVSALSSAVKQQWWGIMCTVQHQSVVNLPTNAPRTRQHHESRLFRSMITDVLYLDDVKAVFVLAGCSQQCSGAGRKGKGIAVSGSHPVCLCLGSRWKKRYPAGRGPPNLSPHRPDQSRGAPSWPLPGLPQQVPESLLGAGSVLSCLQWGHLPLMPPRWF